MKWNVSVLRRSGECERTEVADFELSEYDRKGGYVYCAFA